MPKHRNLIRELVDADVISRAATGLPPRTQGEWVDLVNAERGDSPAISVSAWSRYCSSGHNGEARPVSNDRRFVLAALGIDYGKYLDAWGNGPAATRPKSTKRETRAKASKTKAAAAR